MSEHEGPLFDTAHKTESPPAPPHRTPEGRPGVAIEPGRALAVLRRGRRAIVSCTLIGTVLGAVVAKTVVPRDYEAQIVLQWDRDKTQGGNDELRELQTLVDSVKLPGNLEKVRARLHLAMSIPVLGHAVEVESSTESNIVTLKATADSGEDAARLVDAMATAFLEQRIGVTEDRLLSQLQLLSVAVETARGVVAKARKEYDDFRVEHGITDIPLEMQAAIEQAARLRADADMAGADSEAERARAESLRRVTLAERPTAVLQELEVLPEARKLADAKADLIALQAQLADDHPRVEALRAQITSLERRVTEAPKSGTAERTVGRNPQWETAQQALSQASAQREAALQRQAAYRDLVGRADEAVAKLSKIAGEAAARLASIRVAEKHLADLEEQLAKARDAARAPVSGFRIVAPAKVPPLPKKSRRKAVVVGASVLSLLLSALVVLIRASRGLRVFTAAELAFWARAPVVASSTWPRDAKAEGDLLADLELQWRGSQGSQGSLLVLPFGEAEARHVGSIVARLCLHGDVRVLPPELPIRALRRAAREASRVLVLVESGRCSGLELSSLRARLGRTDGLGLVLLGLGAELEALPDREGDVAGFWAVGAKRSHDEIRAGG